MPAEVNPTPATDAWPRLAAFDLDDILDELRARARSAQSAQHQLSELLEAVVDLSTDLDLPQVLSRIVRSACKLVDARYGALGVLTPDGEHLAEFITDGISEDERAAIGDPPKGHGVLGLLIRDPRPIRMPDIAQDPSSSGFPDHHPIMHSFVGTPVSIRGAVYGDLYMAEKNSAAEFSDTDQAILEALAAAAGVAIENARLYERARRERMLADAMAELTQHLLEGSEADVALRLMARRSAELSDASLAVVALVGDSNRLVIQSTNDKNPDHAVGVSLPDLPLWKQIMSSRAPSMISAAELVSSPAATALREVGALPPDGLTSLFAIAVGEAELGILGVAWSGPDHGRGQASRASLQSFGRTAALALEAGTAQRDRGFMNLLEERERIARDMHDHVIQRLFATGLSLQALTRMTNDSEVSTRIETSVDAIDDAIKDIRQSIFALQHNAPDSDLRMGVEQLVAQAAAVGVFPSLTYEDSGIALSPELESDVLAVTRELLSNVTRHSRATWCEVLVHIDDSGAVVRVSDNGIGLQPDADRSGLANLERRAALRGGELEITERDGGGAVVTWRVPLRQA